MMNRVLRSLAGGGGFQKWWRHCARERQGWSRVPEFQRTQTLAGYAPRFQKTGEGLGFANEGSTRREEIQPEVIALSSSRGRGARLTSPPAGPQSGSVRGRRGRAAPRQVPAGPGALKGVAHGTGLGEEQLMAAHGTSYPPGQLHCARLVHVPQGSEHLQGWWVLGASRRLPRQPPSPALPPTSTRWWYSGSSSSDWSDSRKCSRSISFWICIHSRSFRYCEEPRASACEPPP